MKSNHPTKKLGDICYIRIGGTPSRAEKKYWNKGSFLWVSIADMSKSGNIIYDTKEKITELGINNSNVKLIPKGTLIFSFKLSIGKLAFVDQDMYTNEAIAGLVINNNRELDKNYLYYFLSQLTFENTTSAVKGLTLNKEKIKILEIPLPSLAEQKKIVADLDAKFATLAEMKRLRSEAIVDTEKILGETLSEIFEEGKAKGWKEKEIGEVCQLFQGLAINAKTKHLLVNKSNLPLLRIKDLRDNSHEQYVSEVGYPKGSLVTKEDILYTRTGQIGLVFKGRVGVLHNNCFKIVPDKNLDRNFLFWFLHEPNFKNTIISLSSRTAQSDITHKNFKVQKILVPPLTEQKEIVARLDTLSEKLQKLKELQKVQMEDMKKLEKAYLSEVFES